MGNGHRVDVGLRVLCSARHHDAVGLREHSRFNGYSRRVIVEMSSGTGAEISKHKSTGSEGSVERTVRLITNQHKIATSGTVAGTANRQNLAVCLNYHRRGSGIDCSEHKDTLAAAIKRSVDRSVSVV